MIARAKRIAMIDPFERDLTLDLTSPSFIFPNYGTLSVATTLDKAGYDIRLYSEFARQEVDWDFVHSADIVLLSLLSFCSHKGYAYVRRIREVRPDVTIIAGGSHPTVLPEDALAAGIDFAIRNEGEETVLELLSVLESGGDPATVDGLSFLDSAGELVHTKKREFMPDFGPAANLDLMPGYAKKSVWGKASDYLRFQPQTMHLPVTQSSRGCPFPCTYCFGRRELGQKYRRRDPREIVTEVKRYVSRLGSDVIQIVDNDFTIDRNHTLRTIKALYDEFKGELTFTAFTRVDVAQDEELLELMRYAGVRRFWIGVESVHDETLEAYHKKQTRAKIEQAVETIRRHGIDIIPLMMFGADTDTPEAMEANIQFVLERDFNQACFFILYDFPGTAQRFGEHQTIPDHRYLHHDWRFFNSNFAIHYPKHFRPSVLQKTVIDGYRRLHAKSRGFTHLLRTGQKDWLLRDYYLSPVRRTMLEYTRHLERLEEGLYDGSGSLQEDALRERIAREPQADRVPIDQVSWPLRQRISPVKLFADAYHAAFHGLRRRFAPAPPAPEQRPPEEAPPRRRELGSPAISSGESS
ncbi:MAG: radical SAM protein [Planctomycetota bacterium]